MFELFEPFEESSRLAFVKIFSMNEKLPISKSFENKAPLSYQLNNFFRKRILNIPQHTSFGYSQLGTGTGIGKNLEIEPLAEIRTRTDGRNIAITYVIPRDRYSSFVLGTSCLNETSSDVSDILINNFEFTKNQKIISVNREKNGNLYSIIWADNLYLEVNGASPYKIPLEQFNNYDLTNEIQNVGRITKTGHNGARLSIRIHDNFDHNLTERERIILGNQPQIKRIFNESMLNPDHKPSAYVTEKYDHKKHGTPINFLKNNQFTTKGNNWVPFCLFGDKYWGIAARNPAENCEIIENTEVCIVVSPNSGIEHSHFPLDMQRTYLTTDKIIYKGVNHETGLQTGLIHLGEDPQDGYYYVTQPIPKISDNKVTSYFVLIGREASLIPTTMEELYDTYWKSPEIDLNA